MLRNQMRRNKKIEIIINRCHKLNYLLIKIIKRYHLQRKDKLLRKIKINQLNLKNSDENETDVTQKRISIIWRNKFKRNKDMKRKPHSSKVIFIDS